MIDPKVKVGAAVLFDRNDSSLNYGDDHSTHGIVVEMDYYGTEYSAIVAFVKDGKICRQWHDPHQLIPLTP
jgi:hypothetical protein